MKKVQEIETIQDLEMEIRKSKIRLQIIQFFIDREITYAQKMILRFPLPFPNSLVRENGRQISYGNQETSIWHRFLKGAGQKIKSALMSTAVSILIKQIQFTSHKKDNYGNDHK